MTDAAIFKAAPSNWPNGVGIRNSDFDKWRAEQIAAMPAAEIGAWNQLVKWIASETAGVACDVMFSGKTAPADYAQAYHAAIMAQMIKVPHG